MRASCYPTHAAMKLRHGWDTQIPGDPGEGRMRARGVRDLRNEAGDNRQPLFAFVLRDPNRGWQ
jgi:hypothetical protein